jgi:hypothetical protein
LCVVSCTLEVTTGETLTEGVDVVLAGPFLFFAVGSSLTIYTEGVIFLEDILTLSMAHSYGLDTMHMPTVSTVPQSVTAPVIDTGNINLSPIPEIGPENDITINVS